MVTDEPKERFKKILNNFRILKFPRIIVFLLIFSNIVFIPSYSEKNEQNFSMGKVEWSEKCQPLVFNTGLVRVTDPDMNIDPNVPDKLEIKVWSDFAGRDDRSSKILSYIAIETGNSTGVFVSTIFWGNPQDDSLGNRVPIWDGSTVTALYVDETLPQSNSKTNITSSLPVKEVKPIYKKSHNGTSIPYYIYGPCTMQFLDTTRYQFLQKIEFIFPSPSEQLTEGIPFEKIKCKENLVLIKKASDESLVCVKPETKEKLIERGWAKPI